jgi:DNA gyrase/topoisomerase IV subunit B
VDRSAGRAPAELRQRYSDGIGGTHENGLRAGLGKAIRNFIDTHNLSPKGVTLTAEDIAKVSSASSACS